MMNNKTEKRLQWLSYAGLVFCACWLILICVRTYYMATGATGVPHVHWEGFAQQPWAAVVFVAYVLVSLALVALASAFFVNTVRGIKRGGEIFPKRNIVIINAAAVLSFFYIFLYGNISCAFVAPGDAAPAVAFDTDALVVLLALLIFAVMYRMAHDAAEENQLTV